MEYLSKENLKDKEIKQRFSDNGYNGLFEKTKGYLRDAFDCDKKPISITVCVETEESCLFSQRINRLRYSDHVPERIVEAVESGLNVKGSKSDGLTELEHGVAELNGMADLAMLVSEYLDKKSICGMVDSKDLLGTMLAYIKRETKKRISDKDKNGFTKNLFEGLLE